MQLDRKRMREKQQRILLYIAMYAAIYSYYAIIILQTAKTLKLELHLGNQEDGEVGNEELKLKLTR